VAESKKGPEKTVIIFEDKMETGLGKDGHLGQIAAELLVMQYNNIVRYKGPAARVYAVRIVKRYVSFFALKAAPAQLKIVCTGTKADAKALDFHLSLLHHHQDPTICAGLDLVDKEQRLEALNALAAIRQDVLS
jgi:hypothetical protein